MYRSAGLATAAMSSLLSRSGHYCTEAADQKQRPTGPHHLPVCGLHQVLFPHSLPPSITSSLPYSFTYSISLWPSPGTFFLAPSLPQSLPPFLTHSLTQSVFGFHQVLAPFPPSPLPHSLTHQPTNLLTHSLTHSL